MIKLKTRYKFLIVGCLLLLFCTAFTIFSSCLYIKYSKKTEEIRKSVSAKLLDISSVEVDTSIKWERKSDNKNKEVYLANTMIENKINIASNSFEAKINSEYDNKNGHKISETSVYLMNKNLYIKNEEGKYDTFIQSFFSDQIPAYELNKLHLILGDLWNEFRSFSRYDNKKKDIKYVGKRKIDDHYCYIYDVNDKSVIADIKGVDKLENIFGNNKNLKVNEYSITLGISLDKYPCYFKETISYSDGDYVHNIELTQNFKNINGDVDINVTDNDINANLSSSIIWEKFTKSISKFDSGDFDVNGSILFEGIYGEEHFSSKIETKESTIYDMSKDIAYVNSYLSFDESLTRGSVPIPYVDICKVYFYKGENYCFCKEDSSQKDNLFDSGKYKEKNCKDVFTSHFYTDSYYTFWNIISGISSEKAIFQKLEKQENGKNVYVYSVSDSNFSEDLLDALPGSFQDLLFHLKYSNVKTFEFIIKIDGETYKPLSIGIKYNVDLCEREKCTTGNVISEDILCDINVKSFNEKVNIELPDEIKDKINDKL